MATYISIAAFAKILGVSKNTVYREARAGHIPGAFQMGTRWRVNIDAWEAAQKVAADAVVERLLDA